MEWLSWVDKNMGINIENNINCPQRYKVCSIDKKRRENAAEKMAILQGKHEAIIERSFWEYIQHNQSLRKTRKNSGKQSLFFGVLCCGDCGSNLHNHFNQANPSIEYYNCSNYVGNWGTCSDTYYICLDSLSDKAFNELQRMLKAAKITSFWRKVTVAKSIESQKTIQKLTEQQQKIDKCQNELRKYLATAYKNKVKGVMDNETFVLSSNQFKRECNQLKGTHQKIQEKFESAQKFLDALARFRRRLKVKLTSNF